MTNIDDAILEHEIEKLKKKKAMLLAKQEKKQEFLKLKQDISEMQPTRFGNIKKSIKSGYNKAQKVSTKYGPRLQRMENQMFDMSMFKKKKK